MGSFGGQKNTDHTPDELMQTRDNEDTIQYNLVEEIFQKAIDLGGSDIHFEPNESNITIRIRVDGHFITTDRISLSQKSAIVARIKIMASLKIDEQRLPQDGKAVYKDIN